MQVVLGPRQVGKTTVVKQVLKDLDIPFQIYSADNVPATQVSWISDCWNTARAQMRVEKYVEFVLKHRNKKAFSAKISTLLFRQIHLSAIKAKNTL